MKQKKSAAAAKNQSKPKKIFSAVGKVFLTLFLVMVITGCIVATALTVYVLKFVDPNEDLNLRDLELNYTSIIYAKNPQTGEDYEVTRLHGTENRIWVDLEKIPDNLKHAFIAIEDKRFYDHEGVDWKRTFGAFVNLFVHIYDSQAGGSTITQQLVKNITKEDEVSIERKVQEIFRAINLEQMYSKDEILEAYLNYIYLNNNINGVQAASNYYFGKDVDQLTLAECASIAAITKNPSRFDPSRKPENNKERRNLVLREMKDQGWITQAAYDEAVAQEVVTVETPAKQQKREVQSYFVDQVFEDVVQDLMDQHGFSRSYAESQLYTGGLRIYTTMDENIQTIMENVYENPDNFLNFYREGKDGEIIRPEGAMVILDFDGAIKGIVGGRGEKTVNRGLNRASGSTRSPGSTIKPLATYSQAFEKKLVTWSTIMEDKAIPKGDGSGDNYVNYYNGYKGDVTIAYALQQSINTIPVQLIKQITPKVSFDFLTQDLEISSLVKSKVIDGKTFSDEGVAPMALGGLTEGVSPLELAAAYQIFGNGGYYNKPHSYTKVVNSKGEILLEHKQEPKRVLSAETATIMNQLLQSVVKEGTGKQADFGSMPLAGKTGTTSDNKDHWWAGMSPYYVGVGWFGYDNPYPINYRGTHPVMPVWKNVMSQVHKGLDYKTFPFEGNVVRLEYCTETGKLATDICTSTKMGYYNAADIPEKCTSHSGGSHTGASSDVNSGTSSQQRPVPPPYIPTPPDSSGASSETSSQASSSTDGNTSSEAAA